MAGDGVDLWGGDNGKQWTEGRAEGGVKGARGANANGDAENGEHGMRSRRQSAQMGVGRNVRGSRSAKRAPPSDELVDGGKRADKLSPVSPPFIFPFYLFFSPL